jgi:hypothetical protein
MREQRRFQRYDWTAGPDGIGYLGAHVKFDVGCHDSAS